MQPPLPSNLSVIKRVAGSDPAAGVETLDVVPSGKFWLLLGYSVVLVQGLTQTPQPVLVIDDGANTIIEAIGCSAAQAVSTTCRYNWACDFQITGQIGAGAAIHAEAPLPSQLILLPGWRVRTVTLGIGANSDYGVPSIYVAELG